MEWTHKTTPEEVGIRRRTELIIRDAKSVKNVVGLAVRDQRILWRFCDPKGIWKISPYIEPASIDSIADIRNLHTAVFECYDNSLTHNIYRQTEEPLPDWV
jgi:hypothetical protein